MAAATTAGLKKIAEGREAEIYEWAPGQVLRLFRRPREAASLEREAAAMTAARAAISLVPEVMGVAEVEGRQGLIMERIDGSDLLTIIGRKPWWVWRGGRITGETQALLNGVAAPESLQDLKERIREAISRPTVPARVVAPTLRLLEALPDGDRICHGDMHPGNILMSDHGPIVIDLPNVTRGDPLADFARTRLVVRMGSLPPGTSIVVRAGDRIGRRVLGVAFNRAYAHTTGEIDWEVVRRWEIVRAADRLADNIPEERAALLALLDAAAARG